MGGSAAERPDALPAHARSVVSNSRITLSDSARWDIYPGAVDDGLLAALERLSRRHRLSVSVLRSSHPPDVSETGRPSAHARGFAAGVYAVDGRLVVHQGEPSSPAGALAGSLVEAGAAQADSPWVFGPGRRRSFTDEVHRDHVHVHWSPLP